MMEYIFFYKDIVVGGCEILIEKVSREILSRGFNVKICCRTIDKNMSERFAQNKTEVYQLKEWDSDRSLLGWMNPKEEIRIITFVWEDFIRIYSLNKRRIKTIFWVAHFQALAVGANCRYWGIKKAIVSISKKVIYDFIKSKNIICIDEQTVRYTKKYFKNESFSNDLYSIVRVPIDIVPVKGDILKGRTNGKVFHVLTIARAEFPFKGYLLGLIDFIEALEDKKNVHFDIISYGPDIDKLKDKIQSASLETQKIVTLHGKTDYEELNKYFEYVGLYIGMGTTIYDASQRGIISIPVVSYTEKLMADKFFYEDFTAHTLEEVSSNNMLKLYNTVKNLNNQEYSELAEASRNVVIDHFSSEATTKNLMGNFEQVDYNKFHLGVKFFRLLNYLQNSLVKFRKMKADV